MKELNLYQKLKSDKNVKKITDLISIINIKDREYILKKMEIPLKRKELISQHHFITYLRNHSVNTPKIIDLYKENKSYYEVQEYIEGDTNFLTEELVKLLAVFHNVSRKYNHKLNKRKSIKVNYKCRNANIDYVLLGFKEKYNKYPLKNLKKNYKYINNFNLEVVQNFINLYIKAYYHFISKYSLNSCIIHNDINSLNTIKKYKKLYLIDFDLCIKSTEYVDFVDACMKRYESIEEINTNFQKFINNINKNILVYNQYGKNFKLEKNGVYEMCIIKLFAFYFFVMLRIENKNIFNKNICTIYSICYQLDKLINGG